MSEKWTFKNNSTLRLRVLWKFFNHLYRVLSSALFLGFFQKVSELTLNRRMFEINF